MRKSGLGMLLAAVVLVCGLEALGQEQAERSLADLGGTGDARLQGDAEVKITGAADPGSDWTVRVRQDAQKAVQRLTQQMPGKIRVTWPRHRLVPRQVTGLEWQGDGKADSGPAVARQFIEDHEDLLGIPTSQLVQKGEPTRSRVVVSVRFQQMWEGLEVLDRFVVVALDSDGKRVRSVTSSGRPLGDRVLDGPVTAQQAARAAWSKMLGGKVAAVSDEELSRMAVSRKVVVAAGTSGTPRTAWRVLLFTVPLMEKLVCLVDSTSGKVLKLTNEVIR